MSSNNDFKPGLEGVVAVETEIAEPDREGGSLRYRGVDIEELVGHYPYENVWGLLVDNDLHSRMPDPEPYEPARLTGTRRPISRPRRRGSRGVEARQAERDLRRAGARRPRSSVAQMMSIVARSARVAGRQDGRRSRRRRRRREDGRGEIPPALARRGRSASREGDRHVLDLHRGARVERVDVHCARGRVDRCRLRCALSSASGALSGPLHGGAPAYVKPMLEEVTRLGDPEKWVHDALAGGKRIMGFGHRVYRAEDPRSRILKRTAKELGAPQYEVAEELERVALAALQEKSPDRVLATNVEYYSAIVLDVAEIPRRSRPRCSPARASPAGRRTSSSRSEQAGSSDRRPLRGPGERHSPSSPDATLWL
jgi:citrate synthase